MAVSFGAASTAVLAGAQNPTTITPTMPTGIAAGNLLVLFVGLRADTASVATPTGWTLVAGVGGGGGTFGASTGPSRMTVFYRVATATSADTLGALTLTGANMAFCQVVRLANATGSWDVAGASGSDSTVGTAWSVACDVNPGLTAGDFCVVGTANGQAGTTWSGHGITATGVSAWGTATEINEFNSTTGNDINGVTFYQSVTTGTATAAPTVAGTAAGTTTNTRGVSVLVRAREVVPAVPTDVRVSFPTPNQAPTGTQEFRALVRRKQATAPATNPTVSIELWESGAKKADVVTGVAVTSTTGQVVSGNWNASLLTTASGANVECRVFSAGSSGGTVEYGAIEWNAALPQVANPTVTAGRARPVVNGQSIQLDVTATPPGSETITHAWTIVSGGGTLSNATTATPTYTAPASGTVAAVVRDTVTASGGGSATADISVGYGPNIVAAENTLPGTPRATWDLPTTDLGGIATLQGFADGFTVNKDQTVNFKIAQSDTAGWSAEVFRLGYYADSGARSYGTITPTAGQVTTSQSQPAPLDVDPDTTKISADCSNWSVSLTWTPPSWAPSGMYVLRLNRTGGGASHVMFILRDDSRVADLMFMPADSTWNAYNAFGGMGSANWLNGNSLYYGTAIDQYNADCAHYVSYNRPFVNRAAHNVSYGAVTWSNWFTGEYPMMRFLERNGYDMKYYGCIDAAGDVTGTKLIGKVNAAIFVGHNEYWSNGMRSGWEAAKTAGVSVFSCAGNEVFWRLVGSNNDSVGRPRTWECWKSTINGRGSTRPEWTGTWRDPDGAGKGGNNPENRFTGTIFVVNGPDMRSLVVPKTGGYADQPLWRHTSVASLAAGASYTSPAQILGFEWDTYGPAGVNTTGANFLAAPASPIRYCSDATYAVSNLVLTDAGDVYGSGNVTHRLVVTSSGPSGGITFGTGTINWALGVDSANTYQIGNDNTAVQIQQATVNVLRDMGCTAQTLMSGLTAPSAVTWFPITTGGLTATATATASATGTRVQPATVQATAAASGTVGAVRSQPGTVTATASGSVGLTPRLEYRRALTATASAGVSDLGVSIIRTGVTVTAAGAAAIITGIRQQPGTVTVTTAASAASGGTISSALATTSTAGASALLSTTLQRNLALTATALAFPVLGASSDAPWNGSDPWVPTDPWPGPHVVTASNTLAATSSASMLLGAQIVSSRALTATTTASAVVGPVMQRAGALTATGAASGTVSVLHTATGALTATATATAVVSPRVDVYGALIFTALATASASAVTAVTAALTASASASPSIGIQLARVAQFTSTAGASAEILPAVQVRDALIASATASGSIVPALVRTGVLTASGTASVGLSVQIAIPSTLTVSAAASALLSGVVVGNVSLFATASATPQISPQVEIRPALTGHAAGSASISALTSAALSASAAASGALSGVRTTSGQIAATGSASASVAVGRTVPSALTATALAVPSVQVLGQTASTATSTAAATASIATQISRIAAFTAQGSASATNTATLSRTLALAATGVTSAAITTLGQTVGALTSTTFATVAVGGALSRALALTASATGSVQVSGVRAQSAILTTTTVATASISGAMSTARALTASALAAASITSVSLNGFVSVIATGAGSASIATVQFIRTGTLAATASASAGARSAAVAAVVSSALSSALLSGVRDQRSALVVSVSADAALTPAIGTSVALVSTAAGSAAVQPLVRSVGLLLSSAVALVRLVRTNRGTVEITATWSVTGTGSTPPTERFGSAAIPWTFTLSGSGQAPHIQVTLVVTALQGRTTQVGGLKTRTTQVEGLESRTVRMNPGGVEV